MKNKRQAVSIVAGAIRATLRNRFQVNNPSPNEVAEIWSEVSFANTYGDDSLLWVSAIREAEKSGNGEKFFNQVVRSIKRHQKALEAY